MDDDLINQIAEMWVNSQGWGCGLKLSEVNCIEKAREFAKKVINTVNSYKHTSHTPRLSCQCDSCMKAMYPTQNTGDK